MVIFDDLCLNDTRETRMVLMVRFAKLQSAITAILAHNFFLIQTPCFKKYGWYYSCPNCTKPIKSQPKIGLITNFEFEERRKLIYNKVTQTSELRTFYLWNHSIKKNISQRAVQLWLCTNQKNHHCTLREMPKDNINENCAMKHLVEHEENGNNSKKVFIEFWNM
jgi:hypothetical protein